MKNTNIDWIGNIPDSWDTLPLKRMVEKHFGGCWGQDAKNNDNDVLCIRIADFNFDNQSIKETASTMRNYSDEQIERGLLLNGDLIVEKSGGGDKTPVGRVVIFDEEKFPQKAMFANFSECLRLKNTYSHRYIAYHLKSLYYSYDMHYYFHQTTGIQNLDMQEYLATMLCVPSVEQQQQVVEILDEKCGKIDELIANQQGQIEKLKEYKQSVITEAVTKGLDKSAPMKDSGILHIGQIPLHWKIKKHKYVFKKEKILSEKYAGKDILSLTMNGVIVRDLDNPTGKMPTTFDGYQYVEEGNLLLCLFDIDVTPRCVGVIKNNGLTSPAYSQYKIISGDNVNYFYYLLLALDFKKDLLYLSKNLRSSLSDENFGLIETILPSSKEQQQIVDYLDEKCGKIDKLIAIKQEKIEKLNEYKKSLIYEYVTGKKEVV